MARVAWVFNGYEWPVNPEKDSGWLNEHVSAELNNINATKSVFQFGGMKSSRRKISGWIWGPSASTQYLTMWNWHKNKTTGVLKDHVGVEKRCFFLTFSAEAVIDSVSWSQGRPTYRYEAEIVEA
jgi:hypothetical protein